MVSSGPMWNNPEKWCKMQILMTKRIVGLARYVEDGRYRFGARNLGPYPSDDCESKPYQKRFGMADPWSPMKGSNYYGITPDGHYSRFDKRGAL